MVSAVAHPGLRVLLWAGALGLAACGEDRADAPVVAAPSATAPAPRSERAPPPQRPQSDLAAAKEAARALERGDAAAAARALGRLPASADFDRRLLGARLADLRGDAVGAVHELESLRAEFPAESRIFATAAELHAAAGRLESAEDEIRRGLAACGATPALTRARGVLAISRPGAASVGLDHLLAAREADPELWFCDVPLAEAHVLLGNAAMAAQEPLDALGHARAALVAVPDWEDARELEADAAASLGKFDVAIAGYEGLLADGRDVGSTLALLCQRGATAALVAGDRELAVTRYLRARELGLDDEDLGFGAEVLAEEAERLLEAGIAAYRDGAFTAARDDFAAALQHDPDSLEIRNHLGVSAFRLGDYAAAAQAWRELLDTAAERGIELPEPVHVNLARALVADGRSEAGLDVLHDYLAQHPDGPWVEATRAALAELEP